MGIITIAIAIAVISGRKIGLMQRSTMQEAISAPTVGGIVRRTQFIIRTTILIEIIGAALLAPVFCRDFGFWKGIWYSLFHSISAFCLSLIHIYLSWGEVSETIVDNIEEISFFSDQVS